MVLASMLKTVGLTDEQIVNYDINNAEDRILASDLLIDRINRIFIKISLLGLCEKTEDKEFDTTDKEAVVKEVETIVLSRYCVNIGIILSAVGMLLNGEEIDSEVEDRVTECISELEKIATPTT